MINLIEFAFIVFILLPRHRFARCCDKHISSYHLIRTNDDFFRIMRKKYISYKLYWCLCVSIYFILFILFHKPTVRNVNVGEIREFEPTCNAASAQAQRR